MGKCKIAHLVDHDQAEKFRIKNSISCQSSRLMKPHYRVAPLDASRIRFLFSPSNNFYSLERQSNICFQLQGSVKVTSGWDIFWPLKHYLKQWIPFVFFFFSIFDLLLLLAAFLFRDCFHRKRRKLLLARPC